MATSEYACKISEIAKNWGHNEYHNCDKEVGFAHDNGLAFRFHALVWPRKGQDPWFIHSTHDARNWLHGYIKETLNRYKGKMFAIDVLNEVVSDLPDRSWRPSHFSDFNLICDSFKWSREIVGPHVGLFYNDYGHSSMTLNWQKKKSNVIFDLVRDLKNKGCGIDGVGFQSHWSLNDPFDSLKGVAKNMKRYEAIGVKVHFTEVDVRCATYETSSDSNTYQKRCKEGHHWNQHRLKRQADYYYKLLKMCLRAKNCEAFQVWGLSDRNAFMTQHWVHHVDNSNANPLIFDWNFGKKPAYWAMRDLLRKYSKKKRNGKYRNKKWYRHNMK